MDEPQGTTRALTAAKAVRIGHLVITLPVIIVIGLGALVGFAFGSVAVGAIVGSLIGWVLWAFLVPLWRDWVPGTTAPRAEVQKLAQRTGLVWREGFLLDRTEMRRKRNGHDSQSASQ